MNREFARQLRKNMTDAERHLWQHLRHRQFDGKKFRKQARIGFFIADFACFESSLIVELDGGQHAEQAEYDKARTDWLRSQGFAVLRFWNFQVFEDLEMVFETIWNALHDPDRGGPSPEA